MESPSYSPDNPRGRERKITSPGKPFGAVSPGTGKGRNGIIKSPSGTEMRAISKHAHLSELDKLYNFSANFTSHFVDNCSKTSPDKPNIFGNNKIFEVSPSMKYLLQQIDTANVKISCLEDELEAVETERRRLSSELGEKSLRLISATAELQEWKSEALELRHSCKSGFLESRQGANSGPGDTRHWENVVNNLIQTNHQQLFIISGLRDILFGSHHIDNDGMKLALNSLTSLSPISPTLDGCLDENLHIKQHCVNEETSPVHCANEETSPAQKCKSDDLCGIFLQNKSQRTFTGENETVRDQSGQASKEIDINRKTSLETGINQVSKITIPDIETILDIGQTNGVLNNIGFNVRRDIHLDCPCQNNHQTLDIECEDQYNCNAGHSTFKNLRNAKENYQIDDGLNKESLKYTKKLKYLYGDFDKKLKLEQNGDSPCEKYSKHSKFKCNHLQNGQLSKAALDKDANRNIKHLDRDTNITIQHLDGDTSITTKQLDRETNTANKHLNRDANITTNNPSTKMEKNTSTEENLSLIKNGTNWNNTINVHSENKSGLRPPLKLDLKENYTVTPTLTMTPHLSRATPTTPTPTSALRPSISLHNLRSKTFTEILVPTIALKPGHNVGTTNKSPISPPQISLTNKKHLTSLSMVSLITELEENRNNISMGIPINASGDITF